MRRGNYILALAVTSVLTLPCANASAQPYSRDRPGAQMDVGNFYDELSPYGDWVEMEDYGWSWAPRVDRGWRPYTRGQWVMTDDGWYWDSDERFGWAAYHYGRWVNDRYYGWMWIPGTEWAPAWVSWRHGNGYTGWAPLPPRVAWRSRIGLSIGGLDIDAYIGSNDYSFVRDRSFVDRGIYQRVLPPTQNVTIINVTNNITNYSVENDRVVNRGVDVGNVERAVGRRVPRARTVDVDRADAPRRSRAGEVAVYRPQVREAAAERRPAQGRSLVKGDAPPAQLAERRRQREQESRRTGTQAEVTAKAVQERQAQPKAVREDPRAQRQEAQRERATTRQEAEKQRAESQQQQRLEREQRQAERQQREPVRAPREDARAQQQEKQRAQQQEAQRERAAAREEGEKQRAAGQEQQRLERAQRQAEQQQRAQQQRAPREDARAQQQEKQRGQQQEAQRERAAAREEGEKQRAAGQEQQRVERAQRQAEQQQRAQQQKAAPREDGRAQQQEAQRERAAARQEGEKQRAEGQNQQRAEREQRQANEQQQRAQQQAERQRAKETQREENKDKGKKKAKPSPPPEGQQQP